MYIKDYNGIYVIFPEGGEEKKKLQSLSSQGDKKVEIVHNPLKSKTK